MPDEKRPKLFMGDTARATAGRRQTSPRGVPVEIDPEITPPPQEPPLPSTMPGYDSIPSAIRAQLDALADGLGNVTTALGKVWDLRKETDRLDRIESNLGTLAAAATRHETTLDQFLDPAIKRLMSVVDALTQQLPRLSQQLETTSTLLTVVDDRLRKLEGDLRVMAAEFQNARETSTARHAEHSTRINDLDKRLDAMERKDRDRDVVSKALAKSERRKSGAAGGLIGAIAGAIVSAILRAVS